MISGVLFVFSLFHEPLVGAVDEFGRDKTEGKDWYPYDSLNWATDVGEKSNDVCLRGHMQSPVELPLCQMGLERPEIVVEWGSHPVELMNNGHTVQLTLVDPLERHGPMRVDEHHVYKLIQCHFHWGSEHTIGGLQQDMVAHCVHLKDAKGREMRFGVLAIFFEVGDVDDPFLKIFEDSMPEAPGHVTSHASVSDFGGPVNFDGIVEGLDTTQYWTYPGSLTTPPCTEAVDWYLLMQKRKMSGSQYNKFKNAIGWETEGGNFRPPQLLYGRQIVGCYFGPALESATAHNDVMHDVEWYPYDPQTWAAGLGSSANAICSKGHFQSPIELPSCLHELKRPAIELDWGSHGVELMNNGHTVQLTLDDAQTEGYPGPSKMAINNALYKLLQCHFHWGSEHTVGGKQQDMVAHCVHVKESKGREMRFGVLAIFFKVGETEDSFLKLIEDFLPARPVIVEEDNATFNESDLGTEEGLRRLAGRATTYSDFRGPLDFNGMFQGINLRNYWTYPGSLTTPPCTEAVDWFILMEKRTMSVQQYDKFKAAIGWTSEGGNFRVPQLLHGREVLGCAETAPLSELLALSEGLETARPENSEAATVGLIVGICIIVVGGVGVAALCLRNRMVDRKRIIEDAVPKDLPTDKPIAVHRVSREGIIEEWENLETHEHFERFESPRDHHILWRKSMSHLDLADVEASASPAGGALGVLPGPTDLQTGKPTATASWLCPLSGMFSCVSLFGTSGDASGRSGMGHAPNSTQLGSPSSVKDNE